MTNQVRALTVEDMMLAADVVDSLVSNMSEEDMSKVMGGQESATSTGIMLVKHAVRYAKTPAFEFLASVNNMTVEEFKKLPASSITATVKGIIANPDNADFFGELRSLLPSA